MDGYSFLDDVNIRLGKFLSQHGFSLIQLSSLIFPGFHDNHLIFASERCRVQIYLEHYRVYIEISALGVDNPNLWYGIDAMACFVSNTLLSSWIYELPRGIPVSQVIEKQLSRWQIILDSYFDNIEPLFDSKVKLLGMQNTLDAFVRSFYSESV